MNAMSFRRKILPRFVACAFLALAAALSALPPQPFVDGDVVCFLGDSITHGGLYHKDIADFYALRFPDRKIKMINCGIGGDTAGGALGRLDWDVLAHQPTVITIMLGMNDIGHSNYYSDPENRGHTRGAGLAHQIVGNVSRKNDGAH